MQKRITAFFLATALCLIVQNTGVTAGSAWSGWETSEEDSAGTPLVRYNAVFQDATFDEIVFCVADVLAEYIPSTGAQNVWRNRTIVFKYSNSETLSATLNAQENTILGYNGDRFTDTLLLFNNRVFNHSLIYNSALLNFHPQTKASLGEIHVSFSVNTRSGDEVKQKLADIANAAKAYSHADSGRLEYINKYLIDNVVYSDSDPNGEWGQSSYEAIMLGTAVCGGYTAAVQDLCFLMGIPSIILRGRNHVWNCVYVDGQWKMLDVTWNDSNRNDKEYFLVDSINDATHNTGTYDDIDRIEIARDFALKLHRIIEPVIVGGRPVPQAEAPSSWAIGSINAAIAAGFVPRHLQSAYRQTITRAEYCALAVMLYEKYTGEEIAERVTFSDTDDANVDKMAAVGVVDGVGNNTFAPNDPLNREQAAIMLSRLAEAVGKPLERAVATFADNATISHWATEGVGQVQAAGIMNGVGNDMFAPKEPYTREQSILTMLRLWDILA